MRQYEPDPDRTERAHDELNYVVIAHFCCAISDSLNRDHGYQINAGEVAIYLREYVEDAPAQFSNDHPARHVAGAICREVDVIRKAVERDSQIFFEFLSATHTILNDFSDFLSFGFSQHADIAVRLNALIDTYL